MKNQGPQGQIRKWILHFNIDKTIVMRDSLGYNNTDFMIRQILSELIWGREDFDKKLKQIIFKIEHKALEYDKANVEEGLQNYRDYLEEKYHPLTKEEYDALDDPNKDKKTIDDMNKERLSLKIKAWCDIVEPNQPGFKFRRMFEDMRKKWRVDEKIQVDLGLKLDNTKLDEKILMEKDSTSNITYTSQDDRKECFRKIFKNSYHNIIISFFAMMISLKKNKQDFAVIFRFFGHENESIQEFLYEYKAFCDCWHPRYCGDYGYNKVKFDPEKEKKYYVVDYENSQEFIGRFYNSESDEKNKLFLDATKQPNNKDIEEHFENIDEFYFDGTNNNAKLVNGYNDIYLTWMEKWNQNCTLALSDDHFGHTNHHKPGKLFLVDPYDIDTWQIFFDTDVLGYPDKIEVIDVVTKKKLTQDYVLNKFVVNVEPYRAILDTNYFNNKIDECIKNRQNEIMKMQGKEMPIIPLTEGFNYQSEVMKLPSDMFLQMSVLPLLHNALTMCEMIRPQDPIAFIANFLLMNKHTTRNFEDIIKEISKENTEQQPLYQNNEEEDQEEGKQESGELKVATEGEADKNEEVAKEDPKSKTGNKSRPPTNQSKKTKVK